MRGRLLFNGNIPSPSALMERVRPFLFDRLAGRAPRVLLITAAWGPGELDEGGIKAALNAVGVPSIWRDGYDRNLSNLCAWHVWQRYLRDHPEVAAVADEVETAATTLRSFYLQETAFHADQVRQAVRFARQQLPGFSLGALPPMPRDVLTPDALLSGRQLVARTLTRELNASLAALTENDRQMMETLALMEELVPARTGIRLDPAWRAEQARLEERILEADVLFLFGGDPLSLLHALRFFDLRPALLEALRRGATLVASSAGSLVLCEHIVVFNDRAQDPHERDFRLLDRGLSLVGGIQIMPHCRDRIYTDDPDNLAYLSRRFGGHVCAGLNEESFLLLDLATASAFSVGERDGVYVFGPDGVKTCYRRGERILTA